VISTHNRLALDDGAFTTVERWGERGPVVLAVHGMTSSRKSWERLARHLAGRFRVVAYDQRGHGDSAGIDGPMSLERGVRGHGRERTELAVQSMDALEVVGHEFGRRDFAPVQPIPLLLRGQVMKFEHSLTLLRPKFVLTEPCKAGWLVT